jgi:nitrogen PTS system EIIA component
MIPFQELLSPDRVLFLPSSSKEEALRVLVDHLSQQGLLPDTKLFYDELIKREKLISTSIGLGAALPHAKLAALDHFFLCIGIAKEGIDWNSDDEIPVKFIFLIGGPDNSPMEYLSLLSGLTKTIRKERVLKKLSTAAKAENVIAALC